jgi:hypothetical protein
VAFWRVPRGHAASPPFGGDKGVLDRLNGSVFPQGQGCTA